MLELVNLKELQVCLVCSRGFQTRLVLACDEAEHDGDSVESDGSSWPTRRRWVGEKGIYKVPSKGVAHRDLKPPTGPSLWVHPPYGSKQHKGLLETLQI